MQWFSAFKLPCRFAVFCFVMLFINSSYAGNQQTIESSAIDWNDFNAREMLLKQAPEWREADINAMRVVYQNKTEFSNNIGFINTYWGPINNPFVVMPRPAKVFLFANRVEGSSYVMAPVIKRELDQRYYVFDDATKTLMLLTDWERNFNNQYQKSSRINFNICAGYGSLPADNCAAKSYQDEASAATVTSGARFSPDMLQHAPSAKRKSHANWRDIASSSLPKSLTSQSIYASSVGWSDSSKRQKLLAKVSPWADMNEIELNFAKLRDIRYYADDTKPDFLRRISWLYPDDGCWTRASAVVGGLFGPINNPNHTAVRPSKIFAFGNLCANTKNSPSGNVAWWYHTAPVIRDAQTNQTYVLDPSIDAKKPVTVEAWMSLIAAQDGACENEGAEVDLFNICTGYGSSPGDNCDAVQMTEKYPLTSQPYWQQQERYRQEELGRDPQVVLGDTPPWQ